MKQFKVFVDMDKEEKYLNNMAQQGHILKKYTVFGRYHFEDGKPQDLRYRVDYRTFKNRSEFNNYVTLFEDAGWKHVYGNTYSGSQYFLPKSKEASEDIFSDKESKAKRYERLSSVCVYIVAIMLLDFIIILNSIDFDTSNLLFLTPGLWEMEGARFWTAFLFELPFVLLRVGPIIILFVLSIVYAFWAHKAKLLYQKLILEDQTDK